MKLSHTTLCIVTSVTFAIGALGLQGCSDSSSPTADASPTVDSAASIDIDSAQEASSDSAPPVNDSGKESSADSTAESAADAVADAATDSLLPLDSSLDALPGLDAAVLADGSGDSSDARLE